MSVPDDAPPTAPPDWSRGVSGRTVSLGWAAAGDNVGVASYEVDRDGVAIATALHAVSLTDPDVPVGTHTYAVRALDAAGNAGASPGRSASPALRCRIAGVPPALHLKSVTSLKLRRLGKHRVLVSWKPPRRPSLPGAPFGEQAAQVARHDQEGPLLDGHAPAGKLLKSRYVVRAVLN